MRRSAAKIAAGKNRGKLRRSQPEEDIELTDMGLLREMLGKGEKALLDEMVKGQCSGRASAEAAPEKENTGGSPCGDAV